MKSQHGIFSGLIFGSGTFLALTLEHSTWKQSRQRLNIGWKKFSLNLILTYGIYRIDDNWVQYYKIF